jgi:hypothetical protein
MRPVTDIIDIGELRRRESWGWIDQIQDSKTRPRNRSLFLAYLPSFRRFENSRNVELPRSRLTNYDHAHCSFPDHGVLLPERFRTDI